MLPGAALIHICGHKEGSQALPQPCKAPVLPVPPLFSHISSPGGDGTQCPHILEWWTLRLFVGSMQNSDTQQISPAQIGKL